MYRMTSHPPRRRDSLYIEFSACDSNVLKTVEGKKKQKQKNNIPSWIVEHSLSGISKEIQSEDNHDRKELY